MAINIYRFVIKLLDSNTDTYYYKDKKQPKPFNEGTVQ
jgi:hypothetical protein